MYLAALQHARYATVPSEIELHLFHVCEDNMTTLLSPALVVWIDLYPA